MNKDNLKDALEALKANDNEGLKEKIEELGKGNLDVNDIEKIRNIASKFKGDYQDKSEEELFEEIANLKDTMDTKDMKKTLLKNRKAIKQLYNMMDDEQKKKMERVLSMFKDS